MFPVHYSITTPTHPVSLQHVLQPALAPAPAYPLFLVIAATFMTQMEDVWLGAQVEKSQIAHSNVQVCIKYIISLLLLSHAVNKGSHSQQSVVLLSINL